MKRVPNPKDIAITVLGSVLVLFGIAALVLPGPGLLALFAGMAILATRYDWAERRLDPVRRAALKTAADSVSTYPRIASSSVFILGLICIGTIWALQPTVPGWWPLDAKWWLPGGWGAGVTMIGSALIAGGMLVYSFKKYRN